MWPIWAQMVMLPRPLSWVQDSRLAVPVDSLDFAFIKMLLSIMLFFSLALTQKLNLLEEVHGWFGLIYLVVLSGMLGSVTHSPMDIGKIHISLI